MPAATGRRSFPAPGSFFNERGRGTTFPRPFFMPPPRSGKRIRARDRIAGTKHARRLPAPPHTCPPSVRGRAPGPSPGPALPCPTKRPPLFPPALSSLPRSPLPALPRPGLSPLSDAPYLPPEKRALRFPASAGPPGASSSRSRSFPEQERPFPSSPHPPPSPQGQRSRFQRSSLPLPEACPFPPECRSQRNAGGTFFTHPLPDDVAEKTPLSEKINKNSILSMYYNKH